MYLPGATIDTSAFYQGDLLFNFDFPNVIEDNAIYSVLQRKETVILLSQTCDLQFDRDTNKRFILCPVITETRIKEVFVEEGIKESSIGGRIANLKGNKTLGIVYLPAINGQMEDSFAIFSKLVSLDLSLLKSKQPQVRLDAGARHFLTDRLYTFFCRAVDPTRP